MFTRRVAVVLALVFVVAFGDPAFAADRIGVVLMHGKGGRPTSSIDGLTSKLTAAGFLVATPEMPWSRGRIYDRDVPESMAEIDTAVAKLKAEGATRIVVGGHSMGANAAIRYATSRDGVAAVLAVAPGHNPGAPIFRKKLDKYVAEAREMVAAGKGEETLSAGDVNQGETAIRAVKARVYLSWFDPEGPASMLRNAARMKPGVAFYCVIGEDDPFRPRAREVIFDRVPENPKNAFVVVPGGHKETPEIASDRIVAWLKAL